MIFPHITIGMTIYYICYITTLSNPCPNPSAGRFHIVFACEELGAPWRRRLLVGQKNNQETIHKWSYPTFISDTKQHSYDLTVLHS